LLFFFFLLLDDSPVLAAWLDWLAASPLAPCPDAGVAAAWLPWPDWV
jgi:hypothetical protein